MNTKSKSQSFSWLRNLRPQVDWPLAIAIGILLLISLIFVFSSSVTQSLLVDGNFTSIGGKNLLWIVTGILLCLLASAVDYRRINKYLALVIIFAGIILLIITVIKPNSDGAGRGIFGASVQPTELINLALIIYLSVWLNSKQEVLSSWSSGLIPFGAIVGFIMVLVIFQGDFSAAITVLILGSFMIFISGAKTLQVLKFFAVVLVVGTLAVVLFGGQRSGRITDFINGLKDPAQASPHVLRTTDAIHNGGLFGIGLGERISKYTGLPVPWTDSIFAVIVEEVGTLFGLFVIGLYIFILWRGLKIANRAPDLIGKFMASGITLWIVFAAFINIGALINLAPFGGNALPLVSYGGSSMWTTLTGLGILMNISYASTHAKSEEGRSYGAVIDLRRRNGRRSVSRPRSS